MKFLISLACLISCSFAYTQSPSARPKIGLTLSGGGAKGLAHIGILEAIDSAGLKIDYITGTSMGAIVGALYSVGYSGKEIEEMSRKIDWEILLSNNIASRALSMEEKDQYKRYAIELPLSHGKFQLQTGYIKGQEVNSKMSELFFHVYNIRDFGKFPIPFKCMATDLETGKLIVLDSGNISSALRSTMAIPGVFSAVARNDKKLVDGGLVRNFPVKNVKEMGADIVIGSNVTNGLAKYEKIKNPVDVLLQMAFFRESEDFKEELPLTNIYIHQPLEKYNTASFGSADIIIDSGVNTGLTYYHQFKKLADSLNIIYGAQRLVHQPIEEKKVFITNYRVEGLSKTTVPFLVHTMNFNDHRYYTATQISDKVHRAVGSRYYSGITYTLRELGKDSAEIIFSVEEEPSTSVKGSIYYTKFRGINANMNITSRDLLVPNSRSLLSLSLGESIQMEAEHLQYLGRIKNMAFRAGFRLDNVEINAYKDFKVAGSYDQNFYKGYLDFQNSESNRLTVGIGSSIENIHYSPKIHAPSESSGFINYLRSYAYFKFNNLNQIIYPSSGIKINAEFSYIYRQKHRISFYENGSEVVAPDFSDFSRLSFDGSFYSKISSKLCLFSEAQLGINFLSNPNPLNNFQIGGINGDFRNQVRFAGLQEATINSSGVAAAQLGVRRSIANNIYAIGRANILFKDFATTKSSTSSGTWLSGYALTFAYKTPIGPLELSAMYCDQSKKLQSYVLFGIPF